MGIGRWSELGAVRVCQLVEDANKTSGDLGDALLDTLVRESPLRCLKHLLYPPGFYLGSQLILCTTTGGVR